MSDAAQPRCRIVLEDWNPNLEAAVWADPSPDALRTGIDALADLLTSLVERPDEVTLVCSPWHGRCAMSTAPSGTRLRPGGWGVPGSAFPRP
jgi:hypothetical protein